MEVAASPRVPRPVRRPRWGTIGKALLVVMTVLLSAITVWIGRSVADGSPDDVTPVRDSLTFLRSSLEAGSGEAAQEQFPEGYFFSSVLYGLAWTDLAAAGEADRDEARAEAQWALDRIESPSGRRVFSESLTPAYGVFYAGWTLLLRAQAASLSLPAIDRDERNRIAAAGAVLSTAFVDNLDAGGSPFLVAYPNQSWPVDSVVALAALRRVDRVTGEDHGFVIDRWLRRAGELVDPETNLLPHQTDPTSGKALQGSRGTSQSIIQRMWPIVDPSSAPEVYRRFRSQFVMSTAGFVGVREYPEGVDGAGDVDSGPLVLGFSASSTAVSVGAARANGDLDLAVALLHEADVFGIPLTMGGARRYAFGAVPIGDAFLTWARTAPVGPESDQPPVPGRWPVLLVVPWTIVAVAWLLVGRSRVRTGINDGSVTRAGDR